MLPADVYRPRTYPPPGWQWPRFGDKQLDRVFASLTEEMHSNLASKHAAMRDIHKGRLEKQGLVPYNQPPPPPPPSPVNHFSIEDPEDGYHSAEEGRNSKEGPSRTSRMIEGAKHVTKNYAWPLTRDVLVPAAGDAAVFTRDVLAPAAGDVATNLTKGAIWLIGKSIWTAADLIWALSRDSGSYSPDTDGEGGGGPIPSIGWGGSSSSAGDGHSGLGNGKSSNIDMDVDELAKKGKGYLVEEIYKRPGWAHLFGREDSKGYTTDDVTLFRKRLGKMSQRDLAKVLVQLEKES